VYSAWQIPKAKRLLREMSQVRIGQPVDNDLQKLLKGFSLDTSCANSECYEADVYGVGITERNEVWRRGTLWLFRHGGLELGLRAWRLLGRVRIADGRVVSVGYLFQVADKTAVGVAGSAGHTGWGPELSAHSAQAFSISESRRFGDKGINIYLTPLADDSVVKSSFDPDLSCVWGLRPCSSAWQLFPQFAKYQNP